MSPAECRLSVARFLKVPACLFSVPPVDDRPHESLLTTVTFEYCFAHQQMEHSVAAQLSRLKVVPDPDCWMTTRETRCSVAASVTQPLSMPVTTVLLLRPRTSTYALASSAV